MLKGHIRKIKTPLMSSNSSQFGWGHDVIQWQSHRLFVTHSYCSLVIDTTKLCSKLIEKDIELFSVYKLLRVVFIVCQ